MSPKSLFFLVVIFFSRFRQSGLADCPILLELVFKKGGHLRAVNDDITSMVAFKTMVTPVRGAQSGDLGVDHSQFDVQIPVNIRRCTFPGGIPTRWNQPL